MAAVGRSAMATLFLGGEAYGLAADRVVLAQRVPLPVVVHQDARQVRVALDPDPHEVPGLTLVPVGGRPDVDDARHRLAVVDPHLEAEPRCARPQRQQVVVHRDALRLQLGDDLEALRRRPVEVAAGRRADVARDALLPPAEVVRRGDVGEEGEAVLVAEVERRLDEPVGLDGHRLLAVRLLLRHVAGHVLPAHEATPRTSYAGGIPASTRSCSRTIPSISASGRGGQPGTWMSTATILSTPCST